MFNLSAHLSKRGIETWILAPHENGLPFRGMADSVHIIRFPYFVPLRLQRLAYGHSMVHNYSNNILARIQVLPYIAAMCVFTAAMIRRQRITVVNSHWLLPQGFVAALCCKIMGIPHLATIHSSEVTQLRQIPFGSRLTDFMLRNSNHVISVSSHRLQELLQIASSEVAGETRWKSTICPMGVDDELMRTSERRSSADETAQGGSRKTVLFIGRLVDAKGCEYLVRSLTNLQENVRLILVGTGPLERDLKSLALNLGVENRIIFAGNVDHRDIWKYFAISDVVVLPSIVDTHGQEEGLPVVLLEALSAGKPVIATKTKGAMEILQDGFNGVLVNQKDSREIAEAISSIIEDPNLSKRLMENARISSGRFSIDNVCKVYVNILESLAPNSR